MLRTLLQEIDATAFDLMLLNSNERLKEDPDTLDFGKYFEKCYTKNIDSWAYCRRVNSHININMHIERMHYSIKYIYLHGKHVKRLDKAIEALMRFVKDKLFEQLIVLHKGKISAKLYELRKRHHVSAALNFNSVIPLEEGTWQVPSARGTSFYVVRENDIDCDCQLRCLPCNACIHKYDCECIDAAIRWNMCKHIHLVCMHKTSTSKEQPCILMQGMNIFLSENLLGRI